MHFYWSYTLSIIEYFLIFIFALSIVLYMWRVIKLSKILEKRYFKIFFKLPIRISYFTLLIIALLGPSFGLGKKYLEAVGKDIFILVDLSSSMKAQDISPSRLQKFKYELKKLFDKFEQDRIGLIVYASEAYLQCPLTHDRSILDTFLQTIDTQLIAYQGSNSKSALTLALNRLENIEYNSSGDFKSKVVILASDGEDYSDNMSEITDKYRNLGIKIFTLGIGTKAGGKIPIRGGYKLNSQGQVINTKLNSQHLKEIAQKSDGQHFEITNEKNEFPQLIQAVSEIKGRRLDAKTVNVAFNKYEYFVWIALALIIIDFSLIVKVFKI